MGEPLDATPHTRAANAARELPFDPADFDRARRGLIATHDTGNIGDGIFDVNKWSFITADAPSPDTVNPSLWRQAQLNAIHGLFEVAPGMWQVRGYDISNVTFIAGDTGWIVIDPLMVEATAAAALELVNRHVGARPVVAVIYTHSHTDHFGGVLGVTSHADVTAGRCRVIAPEGFMHEVVGENVIAGPAMLRRALYQFGPLLPPGPKGHVDCGLGKGVPFSTAGLIAPTEEITATGQELVVDGVRIVFQLTPEAEAPAEMNFFFPDRADGGRGWLCMAENCTHNLHNLVPIRGAQVRDARKWSHYIGEAIDLFGADTELVFASHHWPRWGADDSIGFLTLQRDLYRWVHDQTMRLANQGYVPTEIAEELRLPPEFADESHTVGYYGSLIHNVKAVYQRYLSWYDGNPSHLHMLPPTEAGRRYVELAGGADALVSSAKASFDAGDYRWAAELLNHLVFAEPSHAAGRELQAATLEQLGYQSESATFRNAYLQGAMELRRGGSLIPPRPVRRMGMFEAMNVEQLLDSMAVKLLSDELGGVDATVNLVVTGTAAVQLDPAAEAGADRDTERWTVGISNRTLFQSRDRHRDDADATVTLPLSVLASLCATELSAADALADDSVVVDGDAAALEAVFAHLDTVMSGFNIVEP